MTPREGGMLVTAVKTSPYRAQLQLRGRDLDHPEERYVCLDATMLYGSREAARV